MKLSYAQSLTLIGAAIVMSPTDSEASNGSTWSWESERAQSGEINARNRNNNQISFDAAGMPIFINISKNAEPIEPRQFPYAIKRGQSVWVFESDSESWLEVGFGDFEENFSSSNRHAIQRMESHLVSATRDFESWLGLVLSQWRPLGNPCVEQDRGNFWFRDTVDGQEGTSVLGSDSDATGNRCTYTITNNRQIEAAGYQFSHQLFLMAENYDSEKERCWDKDASLELQLTVFPYIAQGVEYKDKGCDEHYLNDPNMMLNFNILASANYHEDTYGNKYYLGRDRQAAPGSLGTYIEKPSDGIIQTPSGVEYEFTSPPGLAQHPSDLYGIVGGSSPAFLVGNIVFHGNSYLPPLPSSSGSFEYFYYNVNSGSYEFDE